MSARASAILLSLHLLGAAACTRDVGTIALLLLTSPNTEEKPLPTDDTDDRTIEIRVEGPGVGARFDSAPYVPGETHLRVPAFTVGPDRVVTVTIRDARGDDIARARSLPYDMTGEDENLPVYISLVGHSSEAATRMTVRRFRHTATPMPDGRILIAGGGAERVESTWVEGADPIPHAEIYDPTSGSIVTEMPDCPGESLCLLCNRIGQVAGLDANGVPILATGDTSASTCLQHAYVDRFVAGRFVRGPAIDPPVEESAAFETDGMLVIAGGLVDGEPSRRAVAVTAEGLSEIEGGLHVARYAAAAAPLLDGGGLVAGGFVSTPVAGKPPGCTCESHCGVDDEDPVGPPCRSRGTLTNSIEVYDASGSFEELPDVLAEARAYATATPLPDGRVVIVGGLTSELVGVGGQNMPTGKVELFDPTIGVSCHVANLTIPRWMHAVVLASASPDETRLVILGGYVGLGEENSSIEVLDLSGLRATAGCPNPNPSPRRSTVLPGTRMRVPRAGHTATLMANGAILIAGGATDVLEVLWLE